MHVHAVRFHARLGVIKDADQPSEEGLWLRMPLHNVIFHEELGELLQNAHGAVFVQVPLRFLKPGVRRNVMHVLI